MNLPADVLIAPAGAGTAAALAIAAAFTVASVRRFRFRWRGRSSSSASVHPLLPASEPARPSSETPLLEGQYRSRAFCLAVNQEKALIVSLTLGMVCRNALEVGAGAPSTETPFGRLNRGRLERLPAPWSLAIRGNRLWLSVPGDLHDPLIIRRRLELACDIADEWEAAGATA